MPAVGTLVADKALLSNQSATEAGVTHTCVEGQALSPATCIAQAPIGLGMVAACAATNEAAAVILGLLVRDLSTRLTRGAAAAGACAGPGD
ncbi:uncharacterized protein E0L32_004020 [Thyridium curvatum]|uniref:Uncharacterized protein n=1 Tax=Thyridium curvatum TaxID=1093900 RepID=A0A507BHA2_9PEZI|nr:uncharacterized protein E0L32_004020 [Thyridium curvatum]TPX16371.1 hypothetical protein E0L32_004020 [Thyridium curvatum]